MKNSKITIIVPVCIGFLINMRAHGQNINHLTPHDFTLGLSIMPIMYGIALLISLLLFKETFAKPQKGLIIARPT